MKKILLLFLCITLLSCSGENTIHGTNPQGITGFLDLQTCKPTAIEYHLDRSNNGWMGPTDYNVEAVLYYDAATFARFTERYGKELAHDSQVTKSTFYFKWLPDTVKAELAASPETYVYRAELLTQHGNPHCYLWFLKNKVLVYYFTM